jgi:coenzyme F420-reducing hydrogenase gamma subunit
MLQKKEEISDLDVAFVEGAITSEAQEKKLRKIREATKKLVAVGSCAVTGMPSGQRNFFDEKTKEKILPLLFHFQYAKKVKKLSEVITVDELLPGCPMDENQFLALINKYLHEFNPPSPRRTSGLRRISARLSAY